MVCRGISLHSYILSMSGAISLFPPCAPTETNVTKNYVEIPNVTYITFEISKPLCCQQSTRFCLVYVSSRERWSPATTFKTISVFLLFSILAVHRSSPTQSLLYARTEQYAQQLHPESTAIDGENTRDSGFGTHWIRNR
jgi:hypothetical protein